MITRRTFLGAAAALAAARPAWSEEPPPPLAIDTLTPDGPDFDPRQAVAAGLSAAVVDIRCYPRSFANATQALADWNAAFEREGSGFHKVLKAADVEEARRSEERRVGKSVE